MASEKIHVYTDGACAGNPGNGGWGVSIELNDESVKLSGSEEGTTNNRMELRAVIEALKYFSNETKLVIFTDSKYVMLGIQEWRKNWKINNWRTSQKKPVKNKELWQELDKLVSNRNIEWQWVKGHSGDFGNEIADKLATSAIMI